MFDLFGNRHSGKVDNESLYNTLGVQRTATLPEIKKAYHKMAFRHHPDKGGNEETFKEVSRAYSILSDEKKRRLYDEYGEKGIEHVNTGFGGMGINQEEVFASFFQRAPNRRRHKAETRILTLTVDLRDFFHGATKTHRFTKTVVCGVCSGRGGQKVLSCRECEGRGTRFIIRQLGPGMIQRVQMRCKNCHGNGSFIPPGSVCATCNGTRTRTASGALEVVVKKGMGDGTKLVFEGEGDETPDRTGFLPGDVVPGDVVVVLRQSQHPIFVRRGPHLMRKKTITLLEALTGFTHTERNLDGRVLKFVSDPTRVFTPGSSVCVHGEGMPLRDRPEERGNLYVEYDVLFPSGPFTSDEAAALSRILPSARPKNARDEKETSGGVIIQEVVAKEVDLVKERSRSERKGHTTEDRREQEVRHREANFHTQ